MTFDDIFLTSPFALFEDGKSPAGQVKNLFFADPVAEILAFDADSLLIAFDQLTKYQKKGYYLGGYLAYEAGHILSGYKAEFISEKPLLHFYVFRSAVQPSRDDIDSLLQGCIDLGNPPAIYNISLNESKKQYLKSISQIKHHLEQGNTYQVNYTVKYKFNLAGRPIDLYRNLRFQQPVEFGALLNFAGRTIISFSPELFIKKVGDQLTAKPMKGTAKRGATPQEDAQLIHELKKDPKNRSENSIIVDLIRNDLSQISEVGSVKTSNLFDVESFKTVHQMVSTVSGKLKPKITLGEIFEALFPCGSITGAPKISTLDIIETLETEERGVYTGAIGYILPNEDFCFSVPIRTVVVNEQNQSEMGIGAGIIYESNAEEEFAESKLKGQFLLNVNASFQLIETLKFDGKTKSFCHLDSHAGRLKKSAKTFGFLFDLAAFYRQLDGLLDELPEDDCKIRILLNQNGALSLSWDKLAHSANQNQPKKVALSPVKINSGNIFCYHKTTNRSLLESAYQQGVKSGLYDVIFVNRDGFITEASRHNIFIQKGGKWFTPAVKCGLLAGTKRHHLIQKLDATEAFLTASDLQLADKIILTNAIRGVVEVVL